ncbi:hypothetical protein CBL_01735 [Carabus blaptoides fortunei]
MRVVVIFFLIALANASSQLHEQKKDKYELNPINDVETIDEAKQQKKRTLIGLAPYSYAAKHVGVHPLGFKYILGYGPIAYSPYARPVALFKPLLHTHGWKSVVPVHAVHSVPMKPVHVKPVVPIVPVPHFKPAVHHHPHLHVYRHPFMLCHNRQLSNTYYHNHHQFNTYYHNHQLSNTYYHNHHQFNTYYHNHQLSNTYYHNHHQFNTYYHNYRQFNTYYQTHHQFNTYYQTHHQFNQYYLNHLQYNRLYRNHQVPQAPVPPVTIHSPGTTDDRGVSVQIPLHLPEHPNFQPGVNIIPQFPAQPDSTDQDVRGQSPIDQPDFHNEQGGQVDNPFIIPQPQPRVPTHTAPQTPLYLPPHPLLRPGIANSINHGEQTNSVQTEFSATFPKHPFVEHGSQGIHHPSISLEPPYGPDHNLG